MITYVNKVFVNNGAANLTAAPTTYSDANIGKIIIDSTSKTGEYRVGQVTSKNYTDATGKHHVINWSNFFKQEDIKSMTYTASAADTLESVKIDFAKGDATVYSKVGNRLVLRLSFKDLPTRFRQWSESYEVVTTAAIKDAATVAEAFKKTIEKNFKRARITATAAAGVLTLTAMPYDDDDVVDSISWDATVRFSANVWYTKPYAAGFDSKNKYSVDGLTIVKTPGKKGVGSAKLVRDREAQAMGYNGVINRGCCTWPIVKPDMFVDLSKSYNTLTIEFERTYRTADDLQRKTKEAIEIYTTLAANATAIQKALTPTTTAPSVGG